MVATSILVQIQMFFIHSFTIFGWLPDNYLKENRFSLICYPFETYYLFLEMLYFSLCLIYFTLVYLLKHSIMRSFSNTNRVLASIIYIGYTNDIIKMFIYYFTVDLSGKQIPLIGIQSGILTDLVVQLFHILLIGFKFFPLLASIDSECLTVNLFCFSYSLVIWSLEMISKTFCKNRNYLVSFKSELIIDLIESIPIYICLSFLVVNYFAKSIRSVLGQKKTSNDFKFIKNLIFKNHKPMKYSRQFICLYSVAFMIIYYLNTISLRLAQIFGANLKVLINFLLEIISKQTKPFITNDLNSEFVFTFILTTGVICSQLILSIKSFGNDLNKLASGELLVKGYKLSDYLKQRPERRDKIILSSSHFPGYLIAHLVYSYFQL